MKIEATLGNPVEPGIYVARQWYGWRILEWHSGQWWYPGKVAQWPHKAEIEAHIGPLPVIARDFSVPENPLHGDPAATVYDRMKDEPNVEGRIRNAIVYEASRTEPIAPIEDFEEWERALTKNSAEYDL